MGQRVSLIDLPVEEENTKPLYPLYYKPTHPISENPLSYYSIGIMSKKLFTLPKSHLIFRSGTGKEINANGEATFSNNQMRSNFSFHVAPIPDLKLKYNHDSVSKNGFASVSFMRNIKNFTLHTAMDLGKIQEKGSPIQKDSFGFRHYIGAYFPETLIRGHAIPTSLTFGYGFPKFLFVSGVIQPTPNWTVGAKWSRATNRKKQSVTSALTFGSDNDKNEFVAKLRSDELSGSVQQDVILSYTSRFSFFRPQFIRMHPLRTTKVDQGIAFVQRRNIAIKNYIDFGVKLVNFKELSTVFQYQVLESLSFRNELAKRNFIISVTWAPINPILRLHLGVKLPYDTNSNNVTPILQFYFES